MMFAIVNTRRNRKIHKIPPPADEGRRFKMIKIHLLVHATRRLVNLIKYLTQISLAIPFIDRSEIPTSNRKTYEINAI